jgi:protein involved in ribonucleotide reduction
MLVAYASLTGNVKRFIDRLPFEAVNIRDMERIDQPYVLVTYTFQFGQIPEPVHAFLQRHHDNQRYLSGVASSGNRNWGARFARAADLIARDYQVPILHKFELAGLEQDVQIFTEKVSEIEYLSRNQCADGRAV